MAKAMEKQMNLFDEGGLEQDGGTVDPVSGNEVPMGSSQEEIRDDIPAQLSEGEFVFPADVVRFIGLEKLMMMRQEAKAGLKRMEEMGQMGNSEEATIPDDVPFTIEDLELEDDSISAYQGGSIQSFANGGTPYADDINVQGGQTFQQQDFSIPPITTQPVQPMPIDDYKAPTVAETPIQSPVDPLPGFDVFVPPVADEYREYINDEGIIINVPYFRGNILPGYTLPVGFRLKETTSEEEGITEDAVLDITEPEQEDKERQRQIAEEEKEQRNRSYDNVVSQMMQNNPGASLEEITKKIKDGESTVNIFGKTIKAPGFLFNEDDITAAYDRAFSGPVSDFEADVEPEGPIRRGTLIGTDKETGKVTDDVAPGSAKSLNLTDEENEAIRKAAEEAAQKALTEKAIKEAEKRSKIESAAKQEAKRKRLQAEAEATAETNRKRIAAEQAAAQAKLTERQRVAADDRQQEREANRAAAQASRDKRTEEQKAEVSRSKREGGQGYVRAKGGIIEKPKKKMKRGGVASKK